MPRTVVPVREISIGQVVHSAVSLADPICDPEGWDASAPCKRFSVLAPREGALVASLNAPTARGREEVIDMLLVCPSGIEYSGGGIEQRVSLPVTGGQACTITVNTYPYLFGGFDGVEFELLTEL